MSAFDAAVIVVSFFVLMVTGHLLKPKPWLHDAAIAAFSVFVGMFVAFVVIP